jgi:5-methylcytosine-specific restriction endonuclease McrA
VHHVKYWSRGGRTVITNLILLCRYHHHLVHNKDYELTLHPDRTVTVRRPYCLDLTSKPRGPTAALLC